MSLFLWLAVGILGGGGALLRFEVDRSVARRTAGTFPAGTLLVNTSGALLLGVVSAARLPSTPTLLLGAAILGSYTTFSTWMFESHRLGEDGQTALMGLNLALSLGCGVGACLLGRVLGGRL